MQSGHKGFPQLLQLTIVGRLGWLAHGCSFAPGRSS
jgi:hypothetical protein